MIKKRAYSILGFLFLGLMESLIYGLYGYDILTFFFMALIIIVSVDIIMLNSSTFKSMKNMKVKRTMSKSEMKKGDRIRVDLQFQNDSRRTLNFVYFDTLLDVFDLDGEYTSRIKIKPGARVTKTYYISPQAIGKYNVGPIKIIANDGLGLAFIEFYSKKVDVAKVAPSAKDVFTQRSERVSNFRFTTGLHISRKAGQGYDFFGIRQYNDSDDMRHVAWDRYNIYGNDDLFVKEWEEERHIDVIIALDYSEGSNIGYGSSRLYDFMISSTMNSANIILKNQDRIGFVVFSSDHGIYIEPTSRKDSIEKLQRVVSEIRPSGTFSIDAINKFIKNKIKKNAIIIVYASPGYGKFKGIEDKKYIRSDKQEYYYIINPKGFYTESDSTVLKEYARSLLIFESKAIDLSVRSFRSFGIVARDVYKDRLLATTISDYISGRNENRGA
ncbi:MAG: DUF58 domain-containing protein [Candidatus Thermoplasmatota archaeon]|jgi:uncharacterized protein (DUF58 family)|nr:DUF58 domain-containing protein [Candidatus Thermoplasmatota archaeon]